MKKEQEEKWMGYTVMIQEAIGQMIDENDLKEELSEDNNATLLMHALANIVPTHLYIRMTGDQKIDQFGFNHIANRLCVQFMGGVIDGE